MTVANAPAPSVGRWKRAGRWVLTCRGTQPLRPLGHMIAYYPLLVPGPLFLFALCWNVVLTDFDAFHVLWSSEPAAGFLSGAGVAVILGATLLATFLLDQARNTPPTALDKQTDALPNADSNGLPAVRPWAYWALWAVGLLAIAAPAVDSRVFFNGAAPFRANDFRDGDGLPVFVAATASGSPTPRPTAAGGCGARGGRT